MPEENPTLQRQRTIEWLTAMSRQPSTVAADWGDDGDGGGGRGGRRASMDQQQLPSQGGGPWGSVLQRRRPASFFGGRCATLNPCQSMQCNASPSKHALPCNQSRSEEAQRCFSTNLTCLMLSARDSSFRTSEHVCVPSFVCRSFKMLPVFKCFVPTTKRSVCLSLSRASVPCAGHIPISAAALGERSRMSRPHSRVTQLQTSSWVIQHLQKVRQAHLSAPHDSAQLLALVDLADVT